MDDDDNKKPSKTAGKRNFFDLFGNKHTESTPKPNNIEPVTWTGMQLIQRVQGTNEIYYRSFPFWGPGKQWGIDHARKTNKAKGQEKTYWTHLVILSEFTENSKGHKLTIRNEIEEVKL